MGCKNGKVENDSHLDKPRLPGSKGANGAAGKIKSPVGSGGEADGTHDSRLPVDSRQAFKLKQSWKGIKRNMEQTGVEMFLRLFKNNESLKDLFHSFKDMKISTEDDMRSNEALEHHATLVMTTLDEAITHIDNYDYVVEVLRKTGASHHRFPGFKPENFWNIREPFLDAVKITLEDRFTDNMESIYKVAITFILQTLSDGYEDYMKSNANTLKAAPERDSTTDKPQDTS